MRIEQAMQFRGKTYQEESMPYSLWRKEYAEEDIRLISFNQNVVLIVSLTTTFGSNDGFFEAINIATEKTCEGILSKCELVHAFLPVEIWLW